MKNNIKLLFAGLLSISLLSGCVFDKVSKTDNTPTNESTTPSTPDPQTNPQPDPEPQEDPHERDPNDPYRVLFLGNSLIFFNDMPKIFEDLCTYAGIPVEVDSVTQGSCTMSLLATTQTSIGAQAQAKLTSEEWDYVIIEPSRRATPFEDTVYNAELDAAVVLDDLAQAAGAETLIYSVWGLNKGTTGVYQQTGYDSIKIGEHAITRSAHCNYMSYFGEKVSERLGGRKIIRAGYAFENSIAQYPSTNLYHTDDQHPNPTGSYLVACTIYDTMFGEEVTGVPYTYSLNAQVAYNMQAIADITMIDEEVPILDDIPEPDPIVPEEQYDQTVLLVGAPTIMRDDYKPAENYVTFMDNLGKKVRVITLCDGSYTMKMFATNGSTRNSELRAALGTYQFDAMVFQVSRRATLHSTDVNASELAAFESMKELLQSETNNIYVFAPKGESSQYTFTNTGDNYTKSTKETATNAEMCAFYSDIAISMAEKVNGKAIQYSNAYYDFASGYTQTKAGVGYLYQCCFYNSFFNEAVPSTCTWQNQASDEEAAAVRTSAAKFCLASA